METKGYIACNPSDGDHLCDHWSPMGDTEIRDTYEEAMADRTDDRPAVRRVGSDDYLYVD